VDWPLPELDEGADPELRLLELEEFELLELFVLELLELELLELEELDDFELPSSLDLLELAVLLAVVDWVECVEPGSPTATTPAAATLASPTAAVVTFSR